MSNVSLLCRKSQNRWPAIFRLVHDKSAVFQRVVLLLLIGILSLSLSHWITWAFARRKSTLLDGLEQTENDLVAVLLSDDSCYYFDWSWSALLKSHILRSCITWKLWNQVWWVARIFISLKVYSEQCSVIAKNNHNYAGSFEAKWLSLCLSDHSNDEEEVIILVK